MNLMNQYTAVIQRDGDLWIGWVEEIPGVNAQGATKDELIEDLRVALVEALEMNRQEAKKSASRREASGASTPEPRGPRAMASLRRDQLDQLVPPLTIRDETG